MLLGKLDEALSNYKSGIEIARSLKSPDLEWKLMAGMAEYYELIEEYEKAIELNDSVLTLIDGIRTSLDDRELKTFYMARERYVFEDIINLLGMLHEIDNSRGYDILAYSYAEQCKSRVLLDLLSDSFSAGADTGNESSSESRHIPGSAEMVDVQSLCTDKNSVILEYSVGDSSSCFWVITQSDHRLFKIPGRKKLQEQIETIRFALQNQDENPADFLTQTAYSLYEELIKPAEPFFSKRTKLVIIPDGVLNYLPFEVLLTESKKISPGVSYKELPFLVKKYPISYVQSASVLKSILSQQAEGNEQIPEGKKLIAFGDPVYENTGDTSYATLKSYNRLEYSGKEVESIASLFKDGRVAVYSRKDATEENVKRNGSLDQFNYIHFATHGFVDESNPDLSSLVLTYEDNSEDDGFLQASEIFNLNLKAELVVLSACQTGLGKLVRGEGMVGLTRAFMYAGTPTVMVSLWSVSDVSTATLMEEFYKCLIKEKLDKADSLRKAQLSLLKTEEFAHPFYWAPFVIVGDWR